MIVARFVWVFGIDALLDRPAQGGTPARAAARLAAGERAELGGHARRRDAGGRADPAGRRCRAAT